MDWMRSNASSQTQGSPGKRSAPGAVRMQSAFASVTEVPGALRLPGLRSLLIIGASGACGSGVSREASVLKPGHLMVYLLRGLRRSHNKKNPLFWVWPRIPGDANSGVKSLHKKGAAWRLRPCVSPAGESCAGLRLAHFTSNCCCMPAALPSTVTSAVYLPAGHGVALVNSMLVVPVSVALSVALCSPATWPS